MKVVVTGAAGQLGGALAARFSASATVVPLTRHDLDITREADVLERLSRERPDVIVNCAAYNAVDAAEDHPVAALEGNAFGVLALARAARASDALLVHYGTDFVFDGTAGRPYGETDPPVPESHYGLSKLLGEWFAADAPRYYVLRVESLFGGLRAKSSIDRILDAIRRGEPVKVFVDRTVTPSYVPDVVEATARLLDLRPASGVYHCVNSGETTWQGLAEEAARLLGTAAELIPTRVAEVKLRAKRPQYCALANDKLRSAGLDMPSWQDALARHVTASL